MRTVIIGSGGSDRHWRGATDRCSGIAGECHIGSADASHRLAQQDCTHDQFRRDRGDHSDGCQIGRCRGNVHVDEWEKGLRGPVDLKYFTRLDRLDAPIARSGRGDSVNLRQWLGDHVAQGKPRHAGGKDPADRGTRKNQSLRRVGRITVHEGSRPSAHGPHRAGHLPHRRKLIRGRRRVGNKRGTGWRGSGSGGGLGDEDAVEIARLQLVLGLRLRYENHGA